MSLGGAGTAEAGCPLVSLVSERWLHRTNERMRGRTRGRGGGRKQHPLFGTQETSCHLKGPSPIVARRRHTGTQPGSLLPRDPASSPQGALTGEKGEGQRHR